jgi:hypothetical protein
MTVRKGSSETPTEKQTKEEQAQVIRDALEKRTQKEGVDKDWFDKHVIVEVI